MTGAVPLRRRRIPSGSKPWRRPSDRCSAARRCAATSRSIYWPGSCQRDDETQRHPLHGSAWLAQVVPGAMPLPVRLTMEIGWFGDATMYLTEAGLGQVRLPPGD